MALRRVFQALAGLQIATGAGGRPSGDMHRQWLQLTSLGAFLARDSVSSSLHRPGSFSSSAAASWAATAATTANLPPPEPAALPALPPVYSRLEDRIMRRYTVPSKQIFAVVEVGGTQYKVTPNDVIVVEKLSGVDVNDKLQLQRVLLLGSQAETIIGRPYVPDAAVTAAVEEQFLDGKVLIFHKRRRKNSRRLRGHRQPLTTLRILDVQGIEEAGFRATAAAAGAPEAKAATA